MRSPAIEIHDQCPYCGFVFALDARDITGELHALRCIDCKEKFVVEVVVAVSHTIDGIAGVSSDAVLDRVLAEETKRAALTSSSLPPPMTGFGKPAATPRRNGGLKYSDRDQG